MRAKRTFALATIRTFAFRRTSFTRSMARRALFDMRGEAVCPDCGTRWRAKRDTTFEIVAR